MQVIIVLRSDALCSSESAAADIPPSAVGVVATEFGLSVSPLHPGAGDAEARRWFVIDVPDRETADRVRAQLVELPSVETAYFKPQEEAP